MKWKGQVFKIICIKRIGSSKFLIFIISMIYRLSIKDHWDGRRINERAGDDGKNSLRNIKPLRQNRWRGEWMVKKSKIYLWIFWLSSSFSWNFLKTSAALTPFLSTMQFWREKSSFSRFECRASKGYKLY